MIWSWLPAARGGELVAGRELATSQAVSLRSEDERGAIDDRVGTIVRRLPVWETDPKRRLDLIVGESRAIDLVDNVGLTPCAFSYVGRISLVVTADARGFTDLDVLMVGMDREWRALVGIPMAEGAPA